MTKKKSGSRWRRRGPELAALRAALLAFYREHGRDLPWRRTRDPYAIWVSEIMLQQTQVDTVVPRFQQFLREFPDIRALASATEARVCEAWAGLGYYRRARLLHRAANTVIREHDGVLPDAVDALRQLPGIGRYTAGAIASIAFGLPAPLVDGNVARVLARLFALPGAPDEPALQRRLWTLAAELVAGETPGDLNQALMELGATVCTTKVPRCDDCPVRRRCAARRRGEPTRFPRPSKPAKVEPMTLAFALIRDRAGVWLWQRPLSGLWAGLWEPPSAEGPRAARQLAALVNAPLGRELVRVEHQLTHRAVTARVYLVAAPGAVPDGWRRFPDPLSAPISALARKALSAALKSPGTPTT